MISSIVVEDIKALVDLVGGRVARLSGKRLLLTGGTGFIGRYLLETIGYLNDRVLAEPCHLWVLTRDRKRVEEQLEHLGCRSEFTLIESDVRRPSLPSLQWDFIIHAAASSDARQFLKDPLGTAETIVEGTKSILAAALANRPEALLFLSTGVVYGEQPPEVPWLREDHRGGPDLGTVRSCYAEAKRYAETLCRIYRDQYEVPITVARVFALVGPYQNMNSTSAIVDFIKQALMGESIRIHDDGQAVRTYCYVGEAVAALWKLLLREAPVEPVNVGSDRDPVSFVELAHRIGKCLGKELIVTTEGSPATGVLGGRYAPDVTRLYELEGWRPSMLLDEALMRTIAWFKERHSVSARSGQRAGIK